VNGNIICSRSSNKYIRGVMYVLPTLTCFFFVEWS
jgi:hypothetical protein